MFSGFREAASPRKRGKTIAFCSVVLEGQPGVRACQGEPLLKGMPPNGRGLRGIMLGLRRAFSAELG